MDRPKAIIMNDNVDGDEIWIKMRCEWGWEVDGSLWVDGWMRGKKKILATAVFFHKYLRIYSTDCSHCCHSALGGTCQNQHGEQSCHKYVSCGIFFSTNVSSLLMNVQSIGTEHDYVDKISLILRTMPSLDEVAQTYMSHRLRVNVQICAIEQIQQ